ncbi:MAG: hypothetical protein EOO47_13420 [Flavobacterium sp.]|nr:MAG: hypothetical protein EOO47_13420 [Flavobacterium sp.]
MIENLPVTINLLFLSTCILTIILFHKANGSKNKITLVIICYAIIQSIFAYVGFYQNVKATPPRVIFVMFPFLVFIILDLGPYFLKPIITSRNLVKSTILHIVRIPVEITLYLLYTHQMIPKLMTFEGRNFDILIGISAPIIALLYHRNKINSRFLLAFNFIGLGFVLFILVNGILSAQTPLQQFAFEQPNKAILYFPFILLPSIIVPIVIYTHLIDIIFILKKTNE